MILLPEFSRIQELACHTAFIKKFNFLDYLPLRPMCPLEKLIRFGKLSSNSVEKLLSKINAEFHQQF